MSVSSNPKGWIMEEPVNSPSEFNSPIVVAPKPQPAKDPFRLAVNFYNINQNVTAPKPPPVLIDVVMQQCNGDLFSHVDIEDGHHTIPLNRNLGSIWPISNLVQHIKMIF